MEEKYSEIPGNRPGEAVPPARLSGEADARPQGIVRYLKYDRAEKLHYWVEGVAGFSAECGMRADLKELKDPRTRARPAAHPLCPRCQRRVSPLVESLGITVSAR